MLLGSFNRRGYLGRMVMAAVAGVALRAVGLGFQSVVKDSPSMWVIMYLPPIIASVIALWFLSRGRFRRAGDASGAGVPA
jgi:lipopolysaccharide export LptBFGC system permease protein LptF